MELIMKLHNVLNLLKGFVMGYSTNSSDHFLLDYQNKRYKITIEEIKEPNENMYDDIKKYLD